MKKITVIIKDDTILFKYRKNKLTEPNLLNTNIISNNELVFSDEYLKENTKIVSLFIKELINEKNITKIVISNNELACIVLDLLKNVQTIEELNITDNDNLTYALCEKVIKYKNIKKLNCYNIPQFMIEELDKHKILAESRNEVLFTSNFMADNDLNSFSKIYYKTIIKIDDNLSDNEKEDIRTFFLINKYVKVIHIDNYNLNLINELISILEECKEKNILIEIHEDIDDIDDVVALKALNKKLKKKRIKISLVYSDDYLEANYLQQIIFTTLKICALIIFTIVASVLGYVGYNNYQAELKDAELKSKLDKIVQKESSLNTGTNNNGVTFSDDEVTLNSYKILKDVNSDMVGWLTVKGTKIDYPVVRGKDNSYYLTTNFYKEADYNGWVFMDYRNNATDLDANTIIYAHNRYSSGIMFGTLPNVRKSSWLENKDNYYITFNTMDKVQKWKIFSYYNIKVTSDYLETNFENKKDHEKFIKLITKRSKKNFKTTVTPDDKILTLSTCYNTDARFVVHAVLVKDEQTKETIEK